MGLFIVSINITSMATSTTSSDILTEKQVFIKMVVSMWETQISRITKLLDTLTDEQIAGDTAPGRNSGMYLIGHLTAANDGILPLLGWGDRLYPELEIPFIKNADKSGLSIPPLIELKKCWNEVNNKIMNFIQQTPADEWFNRHTSISIEDFAKEPHRNKLNILLNRTNHISSHLGQLLFLIKK
jgi:hypothetical protein